MSAEQVATSHRAGRLRTVAAAAKAARIAWRRVDPLAIATSWRALLPEVLVVLAAAQQQTAARADEYVEDVLAAQGIQVRRLGEVVARALSGVASDGRPLDSLLTRPTAATVRALAAGAGTGRALATGQATLEMIVRTQVADAGRVADQIAAVARPGIAYVRMLTPPACSRCVVLAGRVYRWNQGFRRHPACLCVHVPTLESTADDVRVNPRSYFDSLTQAEQDRIFTVAGARAIRDGAQISQVVNARRGMRTASVFGRDARITLEGTTRRGLAGQRLIDEGARLSGERVETVTRLATEGAVQRQVVRQRVQIPRLMPEQIYRDATSREDAIRLLRRFGYLR